METQAFLSLERGTVHIVSGDMLDDGTPEDIETGPYFALSDKAELRLGRNLAVEFTEENFPSRALLRERKI